MSLTINLRSDDLRKTAASIGQKASAIRAEVIKLYEQIFKSAENEIRRDLAAPRTTPTTLMGRTTRLSKTVYSQVDDSRPFSTRGEIYFLPQHDVARAQFWAHFGPPSQLSPPIKPRERQKLAFPAQSAPSDIRGPRGQQLMTAKEAAKFYRFKFTENAIYGKRRRTQADEAPDSISTRRVRRKRGKRKKEKGFRLLFIRRAAVQIRARIDLLKYRDDMVKKLSQGLDKITSKFNV